MDEVIELMDWEEMEVWQCRVCDRYRHRRALIGMNLMPAICCGQQARLIDRYRKPEPIEVRRKPDDEGIHVSAHVG